MTARTPLLISVPAVELERTRPAGSVLPARQLLSAPFSPALKWALQGVLSQLEPLHGEILCVARPEMHTHGESLAWLMARCHGAREHLCLSNGQTMKLIPGLTNDLFFYGAHRASGLRDWQALLRRAPELLSGVRRQYNSAFGRSEADGAAMPEPALLMPQGTRAGDALMWCYPFYLNRHSHADSAERMLELGGTELPALDAFDRVELVDCNESALLDVHFCHRLAERVAASARDASRCLILLLPETEETGGTAVRRLTTLLEGVQRGLTPVPRLRLDNVLAVTELDEAAFLARRCNFDLLLHESTPLWAHDPGLFRTAREVHLYQPRQALGQRAQLLALQSACMDRQPQVHGWDAAFVARFGLEER